MLALKTTSFLATEIKNELQICQFLIFIKVVSYGSVLDCLAKLLIGGSANKNWHAQGELQKVFSNPKQETKGDLFCQP